MSKALVLAEKPSVARDIARVLGCKKTAGGFIEGDKYVVTWALGHLVTLADPEAYDDKYKQWRLDTLPMLPEKMKLVIIKQTSKQFKTVSSLMSRSDIDKLIIATDAGREGELVARWIMMKAKFKKPAYRLWISSQTDKAIKEGFQNLKSAKEYDNLYLSAQARAEADWLVGLNVTRALTCKYNAQLSAGRVQTPTLAMIVQREEEIRSFRPSDYYGISAVFKGFNADFKDSKGNTRFSSQEFVTGIKNELSGKPAVVQSVEKTYKIQAPPACYDLTELQRDANKQFGYTAKQTLSLMQSLYETHKVLTYPRTDSRYITPDVAATIPERLRACAVGDFAKKAIELSKGKINTKYIVNASKVTDHHAIIPTEQRPDFTRFTHDERNIYDLVVKRFIAVLCEPFEYDEAKITVNIGKRSFYAKGKSVISYGWKGIYSATYGEDEDDADEKEQNLPKLKNGDKLEVLNIKLTSGKTKPPARYTEATLLSAMENPSKQIADKKLKSVIASTSGLGTPATRADIIEKLFDNFSLERVGKEIHPTGKGIQLIKIVPEDLKSAELTAKWEQQLQDISCGKADKNDFISQMRKYSSLLVNSVENSNKVFQHDNVTKEKCPECGKFLLEVNGKKGKMLVCPDRECGYRKGLTLITNARCPECHKKLELRGEGDKKAFFCKCGYREKLSDFEKRKSSQGANKRDVQNYLKNQNKKDEEKYNPFAELFSKKGK